MDKNEMSKILNDAIYESVNKIFEERIKKLSFNYCVEGQIRQINSNGTYDCIINGQIQTVYAMNGEIYARNDIVYILVINNNYSNKYILCKKPIIIL